MIAQHFSVVGSEDDQAVFKTSGRLDQAANLVIYKINHTVISGARTAHIMFVEANFPGVWIQTFLGPIEFRRPVADDGIG